MKEVRNAVVLVDNYRRPSKQRNTAGRYIVGAKSEKEAEKLVQELIKFGSVQFYYWEDERDTTYNENHPKCKYKEIFKMSYEQGYPYYPTTRCTTDKIERENENEKNT